MAVVAIQEHQGLPVAGLETPVDAFGFGENLLHQILVTPYVGPAGRTDLDESQFAPISGILFKKALEGAEAFRNALGVIDPIDAHSQK